VFYRFYLVAKRTGGAAEDAKINHHPVLPEGSEQ